MRSYKLITYKISDDKIRQLEASIFHPPPPHWATHRHFIAIHVNPSPFKFIYEFEPEVSSLSSRIQDSVISLNMEHCVSKKKKKKEKITENYEIGWQFKFFVKIVPFPYLPHHDYTSMTMCLLVHQEYYHYKTKCKI